LSSITCLPDAAVTQGTFVSVRAARQEPVIRIP